MQQHVVDRFWHDADFRISLARCRTDARFFYSGCLMNVYFHAPELAGRKHINGKKVQTYELCVLMADRFPVHFGFVDAWVSHERTQWPASKCYPHADGIRKYPGAGLGSRGENDYKPRLQRSYPGSDAPVGGSCYCPQVGNMTPWAPWKNVGLLSGGRYGDRGEDVLKRGARGQWGEGMFLE